MIRNVVRVGDQKSGEKPGSSGSDDKKDDIQGGSDKMVEKEESTV